MWTATAEVGEAEGGVGFAGFAVHGRCRQPGTSAPLLGSAPGIGALARFHNSCSARGWVVSLVRRR
jgi:hypothetical protein